MIPTLPGVDISGILNSIFNSLVGPLGTQFAEFGHRVAFMLIAVVLVGAGFWILVQ